MKQLFSTSLQKLMTAEAPSLVEITEEEVVLACKLLFEQFQKWLVKNRNKDKDMKVVMKSITIKR
jgi:hypothetical protein